MYFHTEMDYKMWSAKKILKSIKVFLFTLTKLQKAIKIGLDGNLATCNVNFKTIA